MSLYDDHFMIFEFDDIDDLNSSNDLNLNYSDILKYDLNNFKLPKQIWPSYTKKTYILSNYENINFSNTKKLNIFTTNRYY